MNENNGHLVSFGLVLTPSLPLVLTPSGFLAWCWLQAMPRCWLLSHIPLFFRCFNFVLVVLRQFWYQSKHRSIWSIIASQSKKIKKTFHYIFSTTRNPATTPPSKSLHDISAKPHQLPSHQKVTRQPKPFDPTTNKPHLSILAIVEAPHQLPEKPATTTHKPPKKQKNPRKPLATNRDP